MANRIATVVPLSYVVRARALAGRGRAGMLSVLMKQRDAVYVCFGDIVLWTFVEAPASLLAAV